MNEGERIKKVLEIELYKQSYNEARESSSVGDLRLINLVSGTASGPELNRTLEGALLELRRNAFTLRATHILGSKFFIMLLLH